MQRVRNGIDEIAPPVAVAVHRKAQIGRGHELGLAERAGPRPAQLLGRKVAALDDLQRRQQFAAEIIPPARRRAGQRRQRLRQAPAPRDLAEVAFNAPHGGDGETIDAIALLGGGERLRVAAHHGAALGHLLLVHQRGEIIPDRRAELGLELQRFDHFRIGRHARHDAVERRAGHALLRRLGANARKAGLEIRLRRRRLRRRHDDRRGERRAGAKEHANPSGNIAVQSDKEWLSKDEGAAARHAGWICMGMRVSGFSVMRSTGRGSTPRMGVRRTRRMMQPSATIASCIANVAPMHTRGPAPKGR